MRYQLHAGALALSFLVLPPVGHCAEDDVKQAVERGVACLKKLQQDDGTWTYLGGDPQFRARDPQENIGATALAGMTLLECGVTADDPAAAKAAAAVREASISLTHTYSLSLAVMFLDRLDDPKDEALIQSMAVRLLAGQNDQGGWTYQCPSLSESEQRWLASPKAQQNELVGRRNAPTPGKSDAKAREELPKEIKDQLARLANQQLLDRGGRFLGDNSNTQFATLALWVARRHSLPVEAALAKVAHRFRMSQLPDGSWHYYSGNSSGRPAAAGTPAMTCAGLLALAVAHGTAAQAVLRTAQPNPNAPAKKGPAAVNLNNDFAVRSGLVYLSKQIGHASFPTARKRGRPAGGPPDYYFFWSLERVGMIYGLKTIGKKDWYTWGAQVLLDHQNDNGAWHGKYGEGIDTCFALLFLQQANVARDLTAALSGKVQEPGDVKLRAGGIGGEALLANPPRPAAPETKPEGPPKTQASAPPVKAKPAPGPSAEELEAARLVKQLIQSPSGQQEAIIDKLKERKGIAYTEALARAIPQLKEASKLKARDALADRLTRMTGPTLREKLQDESMEIRRAAALACAMKDEKALTAEVIALLEDPDRPVAAAAHAALKELTGKDFGPAANASPADRAAAIIKWKEWWQSRK